jgi:LysR family transcriptional regulator of beta-lactamase
VPTDEGKALYPVLEHGFDAMARTLYRLTGHRHIETLQIGVVTTFAVGWLMPRLPEFRRAHPSINNRVEILRERLDMAIRYGTGSWTGLEAELLVEAPLAPLCAPSIAEYLTTPENLSREVLLRSYRGDEWSRWFAEASSTCPPLTGPMFDSSLAMAEIASEGAGVALLPVGMFTRRIADGRLVQPFSTVLTAGSYFLTWPADRPPTPAMSDFRRWLRAVSARSTSRAFD